MVIGGMQKFSLLDYPGAVSAIVFTQGCNFRCPFCYNPMLVLPNTSDRRTNNSSSSSEGGKSKEDHPGISEDDLFAFLKTRIGKLDGVAITGGEPTLHKDLPEFIKKIRDLGFKIKLDTNGTSPEVVRNLIKEGQLDYIAMDIKSSKDSYNKATGVEVDFENIQRSVKIIMESGVPYEFRTTVVPSLVDKEDIKKIGDMIKGARAWYLQKFKMDIDVIDNSVKECTPYSDKDLNEMVAIAQSRVNKCELR